MNVEKQSVARRREPSWRVAATNGLMNLMEAPRYRVAREARWRITEAKEGKRKRLDVEREGSKSSSHTATTFSALLILFDVGEHQKQRTVRFRRRNEEERRGSGKIADRKKEEKENHRFSGLPSATGMVH